MKANLFIIIFATGIGVYILLSPQPHFNFEKIGELKTASIFNFKKMERLPIIGAVFSRKNIARAESTFKDLSSRLEQSAWATWCKEEPMTSGLLLMVAGIGVCLFGFIVHLIRTDVRFS